MSGDGIVIKTDRELEIMEEGGAKLRRVKHALEEAVGEGVSAFNVEKLACRLIETEGAEASFKMVPGYSWATCINVNSGIVHGVPKKEVIFKNGDLVSVDVGIYYKGFHTDTSFSAVVGNYPDLVKFLKTGQRALNQAIKVCRPGKRVFDISKEIEREIIKDGHSPIRALVGHGVGKDLHEEPQIPCFVPGDIDSSPVIAAGAAFAIEVMYAQGSPDVVLEKDGWTISMRDGKISALFEDTVIVTKNGPIVIT